MEVYNGVDTKVIDRAVLYIVLCVIIVVFSMIGYFEDFASGKIDAADVVGLIFDMVVDFAMLFLIYPVVNKNNGARVAAAILAALNLLFYITYTFTSISHGIVTVCTIACFVLLITNPIREWCSPKNEGETWMERFKSKGNRLNIAGTFCMLYAIILLLIAGFSLFYNPTVMIKITSSSMWNDLAQIIINAGYATTVADAEVFLSDLLYSIGSICLVAGLMMLLPAYSCFSKKAYTPGFIVLVIATIASFVTVMGFVIGVLIIFLYSSCKSEFVKSVPDDGY